MAPERASAVWPDRLRGYCCPLLRHPCQHRVHRTAGTVDTSLLLTFFFSEPNRNHCLLSLFPSLTSVMSCMDFWGRWGYSPTTCCLSSVSSCPGTASRTLSSKLKSITSLRSEVSAPWQQPSERFECRVSKNLCFLRCCSCDVVWKVSRVAAVCGEEHPLSSRHPQWAEWQCQRARQSKKTGHRVRTLPVFMHFLVVCC